VGAKVYAMDGMIAHHGIVIPGRVPHASRRGQSDVGESYSLNLHLPWNYSAASSACLMTLRSTFEEASGFRASGVVGFPDVDYCLRLGERGLRTMVTPFARLQYAEDFTHPARALGFADTQRIEAFQHTWAALSTVDPYYNPNFGQDDGQYRLIPDWPPTDTALIGVSSV
jgi:hypothetical protein